MSGMTTFSAGGASALMRLLFPSRWGWSGPFRQPSSAPRARGGRRLRSRACAPGRGPPEARERARRRRPRARPSGSGRPPDPWRGETPEASACGPGRPRRSGPDRRPESRKRAASRARPRRRPPAARATGGRVAGRSLLRRKTRRVFPVSSLRSPRSGHAPEQHLELVHEVSEILEPPIHGREAHERDLVELLEPFHDLSAELHRRHLARLSRREPRLDFVADDLERLRLDRALFAGLHQPAEQLVAVERLAPAVLLHDEKRDLLDGLVRREPALAGVALPPPANHRTFAALARVDDTVVTHAAIGAAHGTEPSSNDRSGSRGLSVTFERERRPRRPGKTRGDQAPRLPRSFSSVIICSIVRSVSSALPSSRSPDQSRRSSRESGSGSVRSQPSIRRSTNSRFSSIISSRASSRRPASSESMSVWSTLHRLPGRSAHRAANAPLLVSRISSSSRVVKLSCSFGSSQLSESSATYRRYSMEIG